MSLDLPHYVHRLLIPDPQNWVYPQKWVYTFALGIYLCIGYIPLHWVYIVKYGKVVGLPDGHYT